MIASYYDILQVDYSATATEIKAAYRKLLLKLHPDKHNGSIQYESIIKAINEAYETLSNPERRKIYDEQLSSEQYDMEPEYADAPEEDDFSLRKFFYDKPWLIIAILVLLLRLLAGMQST
jgi:DnaJ-class molecular chaperone